MTRVSFLIANHKPLARVAIVVGCSALGVALAFSVTRYIQLEAGRVELRKYAVRLVESAEELVEEDGAAIDAVANNNLPFCSDQDIAFMREYVFRSTHVRDLGRTKNRMLYCSTGIGRLPAPIAMPKPDIETLWKNGSTLRLYANARVMFSKHTTGFIVERDDVSLVLNPESVMGIDQPPMRCVGMLSDPVHHSVTQVFGASIPLTTKEVLAQQAIERDGVFYQPLCAKDLTVCRVATVSRDEILAKGQPLLITGVSAGGMMGALIGIIVVLVDIRRRSMEQQLRRAIRRDALTVVYQPVVDIATLAVVGAEALVRWVNEQGEFVRPDIFVALAEARGFVGEITSLVMSHVIRELGEVLVAGKYRVTVNITSQDLSDPGFLLLLDQKLDSEKVPRSALGIELTERSTASHSTAVRALKQLRDAGHMVYIDDFGTGYSSLSYLHQLAVNAIKIDRSFTQTIGTEAVTASVVPQILAMAKQLDLLVVVEGIETEEQAAYFRGAGGGILGQGWLFGKPMPAGQFMELLRKGVA